MVLRCFRKYRRIISLIMLISVVQSVIYPSLSYGLTSGPQSPEFSGFEPVATTDMVNTFTGDFTYNLPVLKIPGGVDGGDYSMSLSYHSGQGVEEEASWVGYGWTLNAGSINRSVRGFPDEYLNNQVVHYNKVRPNWTASLTGELGVESFSYDVSLGASRTIRYNNYTGFSSTTGFNLGFKGIGNVGMSMSDGEATVSAVLSPVSILNKLKNRKKKKDTKTLDEKKSDYRNAGLVGEASKKSEMGRLLGAASYGIHSFADVGSPSVNTPYSGYSINLSFVARMTPSPMPVGLETGIKGNFSIQRNATETVAKANGYMYSQKRPSDIDSLSNAIDYDYSIEKSSPYNKRDNFLGIPFNNADNFVTACEGLGGGFRLFNKKLGHYYPQFSSSKVRILQAGIETSLPGEIGVGFDIGIGRQKLKVSNWKHIGSTNSTNTQFDTYNPPGYPNAPADEPTIARFTNDLGGLVSYGNTNLSFATLATNSSVPGAKSFYPEVSPDLASLDQNLASGSSYIEYKRLNELAFDNGICTSGFNKSVNISEIESHVNLNKGSSALPEATNYIHSIAQYQITSPEGTSYVFGLPVYARKEISVNVGVNDRGGSISTSNCAPTYSPSTTTLLFDNDYLVKTSTPLDGENNYDDLSDNNIIIGTRKDAAYPTSYLLTQILYPGYIDVGVDGPDNKDFGGWTKFNYKKIFGGAGDWYVWRMPFSGLQYQKNKISDKYDDLGSLSKGEKEVYNLSVIETKTHYAFFVTSNSVNSDFSAYFPGGVPSFLYPSNSQRLDGKPANSNCSNTFSPIPSSSANSRLDKIVLVSKSDLTKPIQTVRFEYDYSVCRNLPNNAKGKWPLTNTVATDYNESGKLTLKKVWFEYGGVTNAKISPYVFRYEYHKNYPDDISQKYQAITSYGDQFGVAAQNPDYAPHTYDMWGNHQYDGFNRKKRQNPWVYQGVIPSSNYSGYPFDPAAWQLKEIQLPSGGQIHIQYEQDDYQYVQDRRAASMVSLIGTNSIDAKAGENSYILNLNDVGVTNPADVFRLYQIIKNEYEGKEDKRLFFKFLYGLQSGVFPTVDDCLSEFVDGYAYVDEVNYNSSTNQISVVLGNQALK